MHDTAALESVLAAAMRAGDLDPQAEQRAVAAFRAAHSAGAHRARTRRRDNWRPAAERRARRPVKLTFGVVFASLALGGVAVAAIGSAGPSTDGSGTGRGTAHPSAVAPDRPGGAASSASSGGPASRNGSARAKDTEAHCRAYEQIKGHGKALDATAWQRLVAAAGGKDKVAAYCSEQLARATGHTGSSGNDSGDNGSSGNGTSGNGTSGNGSGGTSSNGNGTSGNGSGGTDNATGNGGTGAEKSGGSSGKHK
ncbi:hypothetical protein ACIPSA_22740 [Streptomyces sp. NPDC086549]|uniref:hypothetical protein n=1 Tax=Streptomyces sp. NPDC086549 TaxID=3365752 RepID=UPI0037F8279B